MFSQKYIRQKYLILMKIIKFFQYVILYIYKIEIKHPRDRYILILMMIFNGILCKA